MERMKVKNKIYQSARMVLAVSIIWLGVNSCASNNSDVHTEDLGKEVLYADDLPIYDTSNSAMALIKNLEDWEQVNDEDKSYFFVSPGDYTALGEIVLTQSGSTSGPRWIIYYNPALGQNPMTHPVSLANTDRAAIRQLTVAGNNWQIVGLYGEGYKDQTRTHIIRLQGDSNVVNSVLTEFGSSGGGQIQIVGDYNVVKNSVVRNTMITPGRDNHGIVFTSETDYSQVIGCEIYNCAGDAIQIHPSDDVHKGCIIRDNDIYIDPTKYFEVIDRFPHENGIDFKDGGSSDPKDWVRVERNHFAWIGSTEGGSGGSPGAIDFSNASGHKAYIKFSENVFYECVLPFTTATGSGGGSSNHLSIVRNIFYKASIAAIRPVTQKQFSHEYYFNTIVDVEEPGLWMESEIWNSDIMGNLIINGQNAVIAANKGVNTDYNVFYNTEFLPLEGGNSCMFDISKLDEFGDYCFEFQRFTTPKTLCINKIVPNEKILVASLSDTPVVGANKDRGVDDLILNQNWVGALSPIN